MMHALTDRSASGSFDSRFRSCQLSCAMFWPGGGGRAFGSHPGREPLRPQRSVLCLVALRARTLQFAEDFSLLRPVVTGLCLRCLLSAWEHRRRPVAPDRADRALPDAAGRLHPVSSTLRISRRSLLAHVLSPAISAWWLSPCLSCCLVCVLVQVCGSREPSRPCHRRRALW